MPNFSDHPIQPSTKLLYLGHTGSGKTGSLCSLAAAGYRVRILDLDDGAEIIRDYLFNPKSIYRKAHSLWPNPEGIESRISYVTITEGHNIAGSRAIPKGDSWHKINMLLNDWRDGEDRPGNLSKWSPNDILVIDSFSRFCESAMNFQLSLNGRLATGPKVGTRDTNDYGAAYKLILDFLDLLKCDEIKCNIILTCHIAFLEDIAPQIEAVRYKRGFPQTIGPKIAPMIGQYFNHALRARSEGNGLNVRRTIVTNNDENIELKNVAPLRVQASYPLETGLAQYFHDIRQQEGVKPPTISTI